MEKRTTIYLQNMELHHRAKIQAAKEGIKLYELAEKALTKYLKGE